MTVYNYEFTGAVQTRTLPSGIYQFKCWGAQGGDASSNWKGGLGGYVTGTITLAEETDVYVYVGGAGGTGAKGIGGFNGGGNGYGNTVASCGGGGASDIRIGTDSLYSRVIVAGGGGGGLDHGMSYTSGNGGYGGGISGGDGTRSSGTGYSGTGGSLIAGGVCQYAKTTEKYKGAFGLGGGRDNTITNPSKGGGGSGWYGGGCGVDSGGGGGSGWAYSSASYATWLTMNPTDANQYLLTSDYYLTDINMKAGNKTFKSPTNVDETGHAGNGYVRVQSLIKVVYDNSQSVIHSYAGDFVVESDTNTWYLDAGGIAETVQDIIDIFNDPTKVMMEQYYSVDDVYADSDYITKLSPDTILTDIPMTTVYVKPVIHLYNKVIYGDKTLIDLTTDTVTANKILNGYTAHDASGAKITGTCTYDTNTQDATAVASEIITGKSAYVKGSKVNGTMINVGGQTGSISTKAQTVSISQGYHDGSGYVGINATEQAKIIADNIKKDVTILGVTGTLESGEITDGIILTYTNNNITKVDIYYSHNISDFVTPTPYRTNTVTQVQFHSKNSAKVTSLGSQCFSSCSSLASIEIPTSVKSLGSQCFSSCSSLASIEIPTSVTSLGSNCFYGCTSLASIEIPTSVKSLGSACFQYCSSLASIVIPARVTSLGQSCFQNCSSLASIEIPTSVTSLPNNCFRDCTSLASIEIPTSITSLGSSCFSGCSSLASIVIPTSVTSLGSNCFYGCTSLASIEIFDGVTSLGSSCFSSCSSLASIEIPTSVTSLGSYCFQNCTGLTEIHFKRSTPATVSNSNAWTNVPTTCKIYVPTGSLSAYKSAANYPSASTYTYIEE